MDIWLPPPHLKLPPDTLTAFVDGMTAEGATVHTGYARQRFDAIIGPVLHARGPFDTAYRINPAHAGLALAVQSQRQPMLKSILAAYGLRYDPNFRLKRCTRFVFHVCDLEIIAVEWEGQRHPLSAVKMDRASEAACRVLYALNLIFGAVHADVSPKGTVVVRRIDPFPSGAGAIMAAYGAAIARTVGHWMATSAALGPWHPSSPSTVMIGADPEFIVCEPDGTPENVSRYLPKTGPIGYDTQRWGRKKRFHPIAEIRPEPASCPLVVTERIHQYVHEARQLLPARGKKWMAGSFPFGHLPIGGHIHFSGLRLTTPLLHALDQYVAVPLMLLEKRAPAKRRRRRRYGQLGDYRRKSHGGFEYRTPGSWLVEPRATKAALNLAFLVASAWPSLSRYPWGNDSIVAAFQLSKKARFRTSFPRFLKQVNNVAFTSPFNESLAYIQSMVRAGREWNEEQDMKQTWHFTSP